MGNMKRLFTDLQEASHIFGKDQLFPLEGEELAHMSKTLHALLEPRKRGIEPRADQPPLLG
jgi:hypothetical protein